MAFWVLKKYSGCVRKEAVAQRRWACCAKATRVTAAATALHWQSVHSNRKIYTQAFFLYYTRTTTYPRLCEFKLRKICTLHIGPSFYKSGRVWGWEPLQCEDFVLRYLPSPRDPSQRQTASLWFDMVGMLMIMMRRSWRWKGFCNKK